MGFYGENDEKLHYNLIPRGSSGKVIKSLSQPIKYTEVIRMERKKKRKRRRGAQFQLSSHTVARFHLYLPLPLVSPGPGRASPPSCHCSLINLCCSRHQSESGLVFWRGAFADTVRGYCAGELAAPMEIKTPSPSLKGLET